MRGARPNLLVLFSDEHDGAVLGAAGHPQVQTPHLDALAARGLLFERAYCNGPLCVPSRLSFLSGYFPHQVAAFDNASVPPGGYRTWGHILAAAGYETVLCGRTHFNGGERLHGFERRLADDLPRWYSPMGGSPGDRKHSRRSTNSHVSEHGALEEVESFERAHACDHLAYDERVAELAVAFLEEKASAAGGDQRPWLLYVGFIHPHFPLIAPRAYVERYDPASIPLPPSWAEPLAAQHPVIQRIRWAIHNEVTLPEAVVRRAIACYWALVTLVDERIGWVLDTLDRTGLSQSTVVLYTSDHGEMGGHHGMWQKHCFYEPAVRVPLVMRLQDAVARRAGIAQPARVPENVSLVDVLPTLLALAGVPPEPELPGQSLLQTAHAAAGGESATRAVFAEYHAGGMVSAGYMLKRGALKYCHYVGQRPQLFDVEDDPQELHDLAGETAYAQALVEMEAALRQMVDPEAVDALAKADQARRRAAVGVQGDA